MIETAVRQKTIKNTLNAANILLAEYACLLDFDAKNDQKVLYINQIRNDVKLVNKKYTQTAD
ncbi:hypothetical protein ORQ98_28715 [Spartinivicinus sp. A2-2]|uniref:Uncharacterized protein n=1 Tax=Spartinivicinus poritis TaxID=2994640 RepID=A0ABT5UHS4_9GAMM|nr:hypothetical protein [Spartinivicinus sp. A2-2]